MNTNGSQFRYVLEFQHAKESKKAKHEEKKQPLNQSDKNLILLKGVLSRASPYVFLPFRRLAPDSDH